MKELFERIAKTSEQWLVRRDALHKLVVKVSDEIQIGRDVGERYKRIPMMLVERLEGAALNDAIDAVTRPDEIPRLLADCQSAITELQLRIGAEVKITNQVIEEREALKSQLERAEALLRTAQGCLDSEGYEDTPREIAAYFRENEKP